MEGASENLKYLLTVSVALNPLLQYWSPSSEADGLGDPFMMIIPPIEQFTNYYLVEMFLLFTSYVTVYVSVEFISTIVTLGFLWLATTQERALEMAVALLVHLMGRLQLVKVIVPIWQSFVYHPIACMLKLTLSYHPMHVTSSDGKPFF